MLCALASVARAEEPRISISISTPAATARLVNDLAFTPDGEDLVSASDDKTIRIWDWKSGVTLRTMRGHLGNGNEGKIFAVAVSPDGKTIAAGGYFGAGLGDKPPYGDVRLFDFATGKIKAVLKAADYAIYDLAFSPDGKFLAAGGADGFVYLWRRGRQIRNAAGRRTRSSMPIPGASTSSPSPRRERGWRRRPPTTASGSGTSPRARRSPCPTRPSRCATSASRRWPSRRTATCSPPAARTARCSSGSAGDGTLARAMPKQDFLIGALTFATGARLVASCSYRCADKHRTVVWNTDSGEQVLDYRGHDGTVYASAAMPTARWWRPPAAPATPSRSGIPRPASARRCCKGSGEPVTAVGIDAASGSIAWGNANPCPERVSCPRSMGALDNRLALPTAERFFEDPEPLAEHGAHLPAPHWPTASGRCAPSPGGKDGLENAVLEIAKAARWCAASRTTPPTASSIRAFTLIDNGLGLITGGNDGTLLEYETATAKVSGEFTGHTGEINAMAASEKAGLLVTGSADQTLRLWNLKTHELIVSMFFAGSEWIVWMPQGYYYSSDDGDKLIGWHVNQGRDHEGRFIRAGQLKKYLWSPEMVRRAIILRSAEQAVAGDAAGRRQRAGEALAAQAAGIRHQARRRPEQGPRGLCRRRDHRREGSRRRCRRVSRSCRTAAMSAMSPPARSAATASSTIVEVPVEDGENTIRITGTNEFGYLTERSVTALGQKDREGRNKGKLYVAVIGVDKYPFLTDACNGRACDLRYPVDDATEFLKVICAEIRAAVHRRWRRWCWSTAKRWTRRPTRQGRAQRVASADSILEPESDTDRRPARRFPRQARRRTTPPSSSSPATASTSTKTTISSRPTAANRMPTAGSAPRWSTGPTSRKRSSAPKGMRFMLLDTCHAANAFNPRLEKDAQDARIVVFSATAANNTAAELPELGHGVFTYSILEGLRGAAKTSDGGVTLFGLADYVSREVVRLTASKQKPFYYVGGVENIVWLSREAAPSTPSGLPDISPSRGDRCHLRFARLYLREVAAAAAIPPLRGDVAGRGGRLGGPSSSDPCCISAAPHSPRPACPPGNADFPPFYNDAALFTDAIASVARLSSPPTNG